MSNKYYVYAVILFIILLMILSNIAAFLILGPRSRRIDLIGGYYILHVREEDTYVLCDNNAKQVINGRVISYFDNKSFTTGEVLISTIKRTRRCYFILDKISQKKYIQLDKAQWKQLLFIEHNMTNVKLQPI